MSTPLTEAARNQFIDEIAAALRLFSDEGLMVVAISLYMEIDQEKLRQQCDGRGAAVNYDQEHSNSSDGQDRRANYDQEHSNRIDGQE